MDMPTTTIASRTLGPKIYTEGGVVYRIVAELSLRQIHPNPTADFSATGSIDERKGNNRWYDYSGGAIHDDILKYFPEAAPVVRVHLADDHGVPMHAWANAVYWAGFASMSPKDKYGRIPCVTEDDIEWSPTFLANHLRVSVEEARLIRSIARTIHETTTSDVASATWIEAFEIACESQGLPARWQEEADAALAFLKAGA